VNRPIAEFRQNQKEGIFMSSKAIARKDAVNTARQKQSLKKNSASKKTKKPKNNVSPIKTAQNTQTAQIVQGKNQESTEKKTQDISLRFPNYSRTIQEIQDMINDLPTSVRERLNILGPQLAEKLADRYGTAAPSILYKNCVERKPRDPVIMVDIKTGNIVFDHLDEFYESPWSIDQPRPESLVAALSNGNWWRNPTEWENAPKNIQAPAKIAAELETMIPASGRA